jgi:DNA-binding beta-propeller fold protein YncE
LVFVLAACNGRGGEAATLAGYRTVADVPLTGDAARFDYQSLDPQARRLYVAHLGAGRVTVLDTQTNTIIRDIEGMPGVHGVLAVPQLGRLYATATDANKVAVIDSQSFAILAMVPTDRFPDGLAYDPDDRRLFVSNEDGGTDTVVDTDTNQRLTDIEIGADVGNTQYDGASRRVYVAVGGTNQLVVVDPAANRVEGRYDLPGCSGAHGLYLNGAARAAYVACEKNAKLVMVDLANLQVGPPQPVGDGPDVLAFDSSLSRLYVAGEAGVVSVFQADGKGLRKIAEGPAGPRAHSVAVDPATHYLYLPLENLGGKPVLRVLAPTGGGAPPS